MNARLLISLGVEYAGMGPTPEPIRAMAGQTDTAGPALAHGMALGDDASRVAMNASRAKAAPVEGFSLMESFFGARAADVPPEVMRFDLMGEFEDREAAVGAARRLVGTLPRDGARQFADLLWEAGENDTFGERIAL